MRGHISRTRITELRNFLFRAHNAVSSGRRACARRACSGSSCLASPRGDTYCANGSRCV